MSSKAGNHYEVSSAAEQLMSHLTHEERSQILQMGGGQMDQPMMQRHIETKLRHHQAVQRILGKKESYEAQCATLQTQLEEAQRENSRLHAEAEQLFSSLTQKIAEVDPLKKQVEDFNHKKQPGELARRCRDEISRIKGEEARLNQDAAAVGGSPLWHGTEFSCSDYVNQYVELQTRAGLLSKAESTLLSKQPH
jgi:hypothetical protein